MRIWTLHPSVLDPKGLVAAWREALLAQAVLAGRTKGYLNHPQLDRFRATEDPLQSLRFYLAGLLDEARRRGFRFDPSRIDEAEALDAFGPESIRERMPATSGQLAYEWRLFGEKLKLRNPGSLTLLSRNEHPIPHPLFRIIEGPIEAWERVKELEGSFEEDEVG